MVRGVGGEKEGEGGVRDRELIGNLKGLKRYLKGELKMNNKTLTDTPDKEHLKSQKDFELWLKEYSVSKYIRDLEDSEGSLNEPLVIMLKRLFKDFLDLFKEDMYNFKPIAGQKTARDLQDTFNTHIFPYLSPAQICYIVLKTAIPLVMKREVYVKAADSIVITLIEEVNYAKMRKEHPALWKTVVGNFKSTTTELHKRKVMTSTMNRILKNFTKVQIHRDMRVVIGKYFIGYLEYFNFLERVSFSRTTQVRLTKEAQKTLGELKDSLSLTKPVYYPTIEKPLDWVSKSVGGYHTPFYQVGFIKTDAKSISKRNPDKNLKRVFEAVNKIQSVPYKINWAVYDVFTWLWENRIEIAGLPIQDKYELPPKLWKSEEEFKRIKKEKPELLKEWKKQAARVYEKEIRTLSKRTNLIYRLKMIEDLRGVDKIYFPHNIDYRGRIYSLVSYLSPQGEDSSRGLLLFAEGKPLRDSEGVTNFLLHGAGMFGVDKVSLEDRLKWVNDNHDLFIRIATDPKGTKDWAFSDSPFQFLAWCFEYKSFCDAKRSTGFVSYLPIQVDGTCNGLQHYAALLKDRKAAKSVNLTPENKPQDVYTTVLKEVKAMLKAEDNTQFKPLSLVWLKYADRDFVKRGVMTTPYGVSNYGLVDQVVDEMQKRQNKAPQGVEVFPEFEADLFAPAMYFGSILSKAIATTLRSAIEGMRYFKEIVKLTNKMNVGIGWTTPLGFTVWQEMFSKKDLNTIQASFSKFRFKCHGRRTYTKDINTRRQLGAIAPNFIHSMDSTHLMATVLNTHKDLNIMAIHDCYATHAADLAELHRVLREQFVSLYSVDRLKEFAEGVIKEYPELEEKIKEIALPMINDFDVREVLESDYFFN